MMSVSELLTEAREHHATYRRIVDGKGDKAAKQASRDAVLRKALETREQAHALDPGHVDDAWQGDTLATHAALVAFYRTVLGLTI